MSDLWISFNRDHESAEAQQAFDAGAWVDYVGTDGVTRGIRSIVKQNNSLHREARKISDRASDEANDLMNQLLNGDPSPGSGTSSLPQAPHIRYLRGRNGARVFFREVGKNQYEILGIADKNNESRVISLLLQYYN